MRLGRVSDAGIAFFPASSAPLPLCPRGPKTYNGLRWRTHLRQYARQDTYGKESLRSRNSARTFAEFFAGIGLMRMGLEQEGWTVAFANDDHGGHDNGPKKAGALATR